MELKQINSMDRIIFLRKFTAELIKNLIKEYDVKNNIEVEKVKQKIFEPERTQERIFRESIRRPAHTTKTPAVFTLKKKKPVSEEKAVEEIKKTKEESKEIKQRIFELRKQGYNPSIFDLSDGELKAKEKEPKKIEEKSQESKSVEPKKIEEPAETRKPMIYRAKGPRPLPLQQRPQTPMQKPLAQPQQRPLTQAPMQKPQTQMQRPPVQLQQRPVQPLQKQKPQTPSMQKQIIKNIKPEAKEKPQGFNLGKIDPLLKDPLVQSVECPGQGKNVLIKKYNKINTTKIILNQAEINNIINVFAQESKIPVVGGILKAAVGDLIISAVVSDVVGSRFIINRIARQTPPPIMRR